MEAIIRYRLLDNIWGSLAFIDVYKNGQQLPKTALSFAAGQASHKPGPYPSPDVSPPNPGRPRDSGTAEGDQSSTPDGQASRYVATTNLMPSRLPLPWRWLFSSLFVYSFLGMPSAARKPRSPTSTGKYHVCHPLYSISRSSYLAYFLLWASWHRVSHGTVSSITIIFFVLSDISRTSGLCAI